MLKITTNHRVVPFLSWDELTPAEQDLVNQEDELFFRAYGTVYSLNEFENIQRGISVPVPADRAPGKVSDLDYWDAISSGSAWNALVIRLWHRDENGIPTDDLSGVVYGWAQW